MTEVELKMSTPWMTFYVACKSAAFILVPTCNIVFQTSFSYLTKLSQTELFSAIYKQKNSEPKCKF